MNKQEIREIAQSNGFVVLASEYSCKQQKQLWILKVPTSEIKSSPEVYRARKLLKCESFEEALQKTKAYFTGIKKQITVYHRENDNYTAIAQLPIGEQKRE